MAVADAELVSRLRKALTSAKYALDETQLQVALGGVERLLANNLPEYNRIFAPLVMPPVADDRLETLIAEKFDAMIQVEKGKVEIRTLRQENDDLRAQLREATRATPAPSVEQKPLRKPWTANEYQDGVRMFISGASWSEVARALARTEGEIKGKFTNRAPDESLLANPIVVLPDGQMDILELWKVAHGVYGEGWRAKLESRFHMPEETILWHTPVDVLTAEQTQELRAEWGRSRRARTEAHEETYRAFERIAKRYDPANGGISWQEIIVQMRPETPIATELGPQFAARFDSENDVRLFKIRESTRNIVSGEVPQLLPLTQELQEHLRNLEPQPMASHLPVYEGILCAGRKGITIRQLQIAGWGRQVGMTYHQMGRAPIHLERQRLIKRLDGDDKGTLLATYWIKDA